MTANTTIIRTAKDRENPYVMIDKAFLHNQNLSWQAKGLLAYLLSLPEDWNIRLRALEKQATNGINALRAVIKELETAGYIKSSRTKDNLGKFTGTLYKIIESPQTNSPHTENPYTENPYTENPYTDNPYTDNQTLLINNSTNKQDTNIGRVRSCEGFVREDVGVGAELNSALPAAKPKSNLAKPVSNQLFDQFWEKYPRKVAKIKAQQAFIKLNPDENTFSQMMRALSTHCKSRQWHSEPKYIPHAATWLNQQRWLDELSQSDYAYAEGKVCIVCGSEGFKCQKSKIYNQLTYLCQSCYKSYTKQNRNWDALNKDQIAKAIKITNDELAIRNCFHHEDLEGLEEI